MLEGFRSPLDGFGTIFGAFRTVLIELFDWGFIAATADESEDYGSITSATTDTNDYRFL